MATAVIYAATNGFFDTFPPEETAKAESRLQEFLQREAQEELKAIRDSRDLSDETVEALRNKLTQFVERS